MQQRTSLTLSPDRREAAVCGTAGFPCGAYFIDIALYPASAISWHWREEIELSMVVGGAARVRFGSGAFVLNAGRACSSTLRRCTPLTSSATRAAA